MQRSSDSIASLAAALAKAQTELGNPEKSLAATIRPDGHGGGERTFRYASLSSGLDIVRKVLGQHAIAVMQTSAIGHIGTGVFALVSTRFETSAETLFEILFTPPWSSRDHAAATSGAAARNGRPFVGADMGAVRPWVLGASMCLKSGDVRTVASLSA
jgi:hypothetical protein